VRPSVIAVLLGTVWTAASSPAARAADPPQLGRSPLRDVVAALTRDEKVGLVMGTGMSFPACLRTCRRPWWARPPPACPAPPAPRLAIPRLGIPSIVVADGPGRLRIQPRGKGEEAGPITAPAFPVATSLASSWDVDLVERVGRAMATRSRNTAWTSSSRPRSTSIAIRSGPELRVLLRGPGRRGTDGGGMVRGLQSQGVGTSVKHFAANNHEWNRNTIDVKVSPRALREIYLRGFEIAVREGEPGRSCPPTTRSTGPTPPRARPSSRVSCATTGSSTALVMTDWFGGRTPWPR